MKKKTLKEFSKKVISLTKSATKKVKGGQDEIIIEDVIDC